MTSGYCTEQSSSTTCYLGLSGPSFFITAIVLWESWNNAQEDKDPSDSQNPGSWMDVMMPHAHGSCNLVDVSSRGHRLVIYRLNSNCRHSWLIQWKIISCWRLKNQKISHQNMDFQLLLRNQKTPPDNIQTEMSSSSLLYSAPGFFSLPHSPPCPMV